MITLMHVTVSITFWSLKCDTTIPVSQTWVQKLVIGVELLTHEMTFAY